MDYRRPLLGRHQFVILGNLGISTAAAFEHAMPNLTVNWACAEAPRNPIISTLEHTSRSRDAAHTRLL
jgi:hypothetical protein